MAGAGVLCSMGAVRAGAGLVRLATAAGMLAIVSRRVPLEVTTESYPDAAGRMAAEAWKALAKSIDAFRPHVVAVGPGLGQAPPVERCVRRLLEGRVPLVIDADGLNVLARIRGKSLLRHPPMVVTPHEGEAARLLRRSAAWVTRHREAAALETARQYRSVCVLKGAGTLVTDGKTIWKNISGNPKMASGGTGDVLTGVIAAVWGQMDDRTAASAVKAASVAVFVHGKAGDLSSVRSGLSVLASDLAGSLTTAFRKIHAK